MMLLNSLLREHELSDKPATNPMITIFRTKHLAVSEELCTFALINN